MYSVAQDIQEDPNKLDEATHPVSTAQRKAKKLSLLPHDMTVGEWERRKTHIRRNLKRSTGMEVGDIRLGDQARFSRTDVKKSKKGYLQQSDFDTADQNNEFPWNVAARREALEHIKRTYPQEWRKHKAASAKRKQQAGIAKSKERKKNPNHPSVRDMDQRKRYMERIASDKDFRNQQGNKRYTRDEMFGDAPWHVDERTGEEYKLHMPYKRAKVRAGTLDQSKLKPPESYYRKPSHTERTIEEDVRQRKGHKYDPVLAAEGRRKSSEWNRITSNNLQKSQTGVAKSAPVWDWNNSPFGWNR